MDWELKTVRDFGVNLFEKMRRSTRVCQNVGQDDGGLLHRLDPAGVALPLHLAPFRERPGRRGRQRLSFLNTP